MNSGSNEWQAMANSGAALSQEAIWGKLKYTKLNKLLGAAELAHISYMGEIILRGSPDYSSYKNIEILKLQFSNINEGNY